MTENEEMPTTWQFVKHLLEFIILPFVLCVYVLLPIIGGLAIMIFFIYFSIYTMVLCWIVYVENEENE